MWSCKDIDISWPDWLKAVNLCLAVPLHPIQTPSTNDRLPSNSLLCLAARSGFDLYLRSKRWNTGDEVICSALTVPDMQRIMESHGLVPIPVDIDPETGCWRHEELERAISPRSRAFLLAHLFGNRFDLQPAIEIARRHGLDVIEDCAQAWRGPNWWGHSEADASLFSFGPTKTQTSLGGGLIRTKVPRQLVQMQALIEADPPQPNLHHLKRVLGYGLAKAFSTRHAFACFVATTKALGSDHETVIHQLTRNVPSRNLLAAIRQQPCGALLALLNHRVSSDCQRLEARIAAGRTLVGAFSSSVAMPSRHNPSNRYWVIPVLAKRPEQLKRELRLNGFDAVSGRLSTISANPHQVKGALQLEKAVYLAFRPDMPNRELLRLGKQVSQYFNSEC